MPHRRALPFAALLAGAALLASSCSLADLGGQNADRPAGDGRAAPATREPRAARRRPGPAWATGAPVRVVMNDRFRYRPAAIMVRAGRRVTFDVTNAGKLPHEFILGDRATQLDHERQMQGGPPAGATATPMPTTPMPAMPRRAPAAPSPSPPARPGGSPGPSTSPGSSSTAATSSATGRPA